MYVKSIDPFERKIKEKKEKENKYNHFFFEFAVF